MATSAKRIGVIVAIGVLLGGIGALVITSRMREATEGEAAPSPPKVTQARRAELLPQMKATRFPGIDGQCQGKGYPRFGFVLEGGTYAENTAIGLEAACKPFGGTQKNITNFFCCLTETPFGASDGG